MYSNFTVLSVETRWNIGTIYIDDVRLEEGGKLELSQWDQPVPEDRLLPVKHKFARPLDAGVLRRFTLESRCQRMIHASFPPSDVMNLDYHVPAGMTDDGEQELNPEVDMPDYREKVPRLLVHVQIATV